MSGFVWRRAIPVLFAILLVTAKPPSASAQATAEPINPIPRGFPGNTQKAALGEKLFKDQRLSGNGRIACVSCHQISSNGADAQALPLPVGGNPPIHNTPTVFNAALNYRFNWYGNFKTLGEQAEHALLSPGEMNSNWPHLLTIVRNDANYLDAFRKNYKTGITRGNILDAIVTYERTLLTPDALFDRYLRKEAMLSDDEQQGYVLFKLHGCSSCHQGINIGGNLFQKLGVFTKYLKPRTKLQDSDRGRFTITGDKGDLYVFRVPSLRNVAVTSPYFHDGDIDTLERAVGIMAEYQLGMTLKKQEIHLIVKFLNTLTGEYQGRSLTKPGS